MNRSYATTIAIFAHTLCTMGCGNEQTSSSSSSSGSSSGSGSGSGSGSSTVGGSGSSSGSTGGGGTGGADGGGTDGGDYDCTPTVNTAAPIDEMYSNEERPTPTGGTIADGTYDLVSRILYTGPTGMSGKTGKSFKETVIFKNMGPGTVFIKATFSVNDGPEQHSFYKGAVDGINLSPSAICGGTGSAVWQFTATSTQLNSFAVADGYPGMAVFAKK